MPSSPLLEPDPKSMDEQMRRLSDEERRLDDVMSGDPRSLTRKDRDQAVKYYRELRAQWAKDEMAGAKRAKAPKHPPGHIVMPEDLGL